MPAHTPRAALVDHVVYFAVPAVDAHLFPRLFRHGPQASRTGDLDSLRLTEDGDKTGENVVASELPMLLQEFVPDLAQLLFRQPVIAVLDGIEILSSSRWPA